MLTITIDHQPVKDPNTGQLVFYALETFNVDSPEWDYPEQLAISLVEMLCERYGLRECVQCGKLAPPPSMTEDKAGNALCPPCAAEPLEGVCDACGQTTELEDLRRCNDQWECPTCVAEHLFHPEREAGDQMDDAVTQVYEDMEYCAGQFQAGHMTEDQYGRALEMVLRIVAEQYNVEYEDLYTAYHEAS